MINVQVFCIFLFTIIVIICTREYKISTFNKDHKLQVQRNKTPKWCTAHQKDPQHSKNTHPNPHVSINPRLLTATAMHGIAWLLHYNGLRSG